MVLLPRIQGDVGDHDARSGTCAVALLADLLSAASPNGIRSVLSEITSALTEPEFLHSRSGRLREAASRLTGEVVRVWKADGELEWEEELVPVIWILLHLASMEGAEASGEESKVRSFERVLLCTSDWKQLIVYWTKGFESECTGDWKQLIFCWTRAFQSEQQRVRDL
jgi:hypothetical protein